VWPVWLQAARACFAYFDLGIYTEALARLSFADPNSWLSGRQVNLFNDHFDPVLWLARPLAWALPPMWAGLFAEALFLLLAALPLVWLHARGLLSRGATALLVALVLLSVGTVDALRYPIHPTTWAAMPWVLTGVAFHLRRNGVLLVGLVLLFACKEEFAFGGLMVAVALALRGQRRFAVGVALLSLAWLWGVYVLRPWWLGPTQGYGHRLLEGWDAGAPDYLGRRLSPQHLSRMGTLVLAFLPLAVWMWRERLHPDWAWLLVLLPMLGIRLLAMAWRHHYVAPVVAALVVGVLPALRVRRPPAWVMATTAALLLTTNVPNLRHVSRTVFSSATFPERCPGNSERLASISRGLDVIAAHPEGAALLGGNLLTPVTRRRDVFMVGGPQSTADTVYDWVLVEKPPSGDPWPLAAEHVDALIAGWRLTPGARVLIDDAHVFLAHGRFTARW